MPGELHLGLGILQSPGAPALGLEASLSGVSQIPGQLRGKARVFLEWQPGWEQGWSQPSFGASHVPLCFLPDVGLLAGADRADGEKRLRLSSGNPASGALGAAWSLPGCFLGSVGALGSEDWPHGRRGAWMEVPVGCCHPRRPSVTRSPGDPAGRAGDPADAGEPARSWRGGGTVLAGARVAVTRVPLPGRVWTPGRSRPQGARGWARPLGSYPP